MTDWATIASAATAGGTLVLAGATFSSVRSANRAARIAERSLQVGLRPVLMPTRIEDPGEKINFLDEHYVRVNGGMGVVEEADGNMYMAMGLRNAGAGMAILHGWFIPRVEEDPTTWSPTQPESFRRITRDLYVPGGDIGFWQGAIRDPEDGCYPTVLAAVKERQPLTIDLLYGDQDGGQRMVSRFRLTPRQEGVERLCSVGRHWYLDRPPPR